MDSIRDAPVVPDKRQVALYDAWVLRYYRDVYRLLYRLSGDTGVAEDLTQETFVQAWRGLPGFRGECRTWTWLYRIALNAWRQVARRVTDEAAGPAADDAPDQRPGPDVEAEDRDLCRHVAAALAALPATYREVLVLCKVQGLTLRQAAAVLDEPVGTVKWRVHEGLEQLRRRLGEDDR